MSDNQPIDRRRFLIVMGSLLAGTSLAQASPHPSGPGSQAPQASLTPQAYLPFVAGSAAPGAQRVVHIHSADATAWDFGTGWYGDYVDQDVVQEMVDQGVTRLTSTSTRAAAWQALLPNYVPGQMVALKANLNNARSADDSDNVIDALIEPVDAVIRGLTEIGVAESDIWVYDAVRWIPDRFRNGCGFPGVQFSGCDDPNSQGFSETEKVVFEPPPGVPSLAAQRISNVLVNAHYLINMPIMKRHSIAKVTLAFKNHFGSIEDPRALHDHIRPGSSIYTPAYNPMVDMYKNPHFVDKTVLTIGDGLFGCRQNQASEPEPWVTFNNRAPNSLFFSTDPVALECVLYDFLDAEVGVEPGGDDYLKLAAQEGLGVFEHRAPGISDPSRWYERIDYSYLEM